MESKKVSVSFVIPCYNEFDRFPLNSYLDCLSKKTSIQFVFVNDGSTDETLKLLQTLKSRHSGAVDIIDNKFNLGKGNAVQRGVQYLLENSECDYIGFIDADLATPFSEVFKLLKLITREKYGLIFASRVSVFGSNIKRKSVRHYGGRVIATFIDRILKLSIYDTQCGLKIFSKDLASYVFTDPFITRWFFDVEIFSRLNLILEKHQLSKIMKEVPIHEWTEKGGSKVRFLDILKVPYFLIKIYFYYRSKSGGQKLTNKLEFTP